MRSFAHNADRQDCSPAAPLFASLWGLIRPGTSQPSCLEEEAVMRKVFAVVLIALCTWYAKHVMIMVDSVIQQFSHFVH